jgi:hypothetical protein
MENNMGDESQELKDTIYASVNELLDANHKRMTDWEKGVITNIQGNITDLLRDISPKAMPFYYHIALIVIEGATIGLSVGLTLHFFK